MNEPRVAHLVYDLIRGGTEGQCARVATGLARRGFSHRVAAFFRRGFFMEDVERACGPVHEVAIRHLVRWSTWRELLRLAGWLRREEIDILHAWDADAAVFGQFAARQAGVKLVASRRDLGQIYPPWKRVLMQRADRVAKRVVANAEAVRSHFVAQGLAAGKIVLLPNLLDLDEFDDQARAHVGWADRLPPGRRMVVVNRLDPEKNTGLLIAALPLVRREIPDAVLIVAGDGREMPALRKQVSGLGLDACVCFLGEIQAVPALLKNCEAGALVPMRNEGLSNTILEYMAAELPALASDCGGNRELVRNGTTGCLVGPQASAAEVARAWVSLLRDPVAAREMGRTARLFVEGKHARDAVLDAFADLYRHVQESS